MKHYKGFDISKNGQVPYKYKIWYGLRMAGAFKTIKECKEYINLILWSRENIPQ